MPPTTRSQTRIHTTVLLAHSPSLMQAEDTGSIILEIKENDIKRSRGPEVLLNHLMIERIVAYLPDVIDLANLSRCNKAVQKDVKHYLIRNAKVLSFSNAKGILNRQICAFLWDFSKPNSSHNMLSKMGRWEALIELDLSDTGVTDRMIESIILNTFKNVDFTDFKFSLDSETRLPFEAFVNLQVIKAQRCPRLDVGLILDKLKRLLFRQLEKFWERNDGPASILPQVLTGVKSPLGSEIWRGTIPNSAAVLNTTGLVGYTRLRKLYLANSYKLAINREAWDVMSDSDDPDFYLFARNVARYLAITGALGIETELRFCSSYCDTFNVFLFDGWNCQVSPDMVSDWEKMRMEVETYRLIRTKGMADFIKIAPQSPVSRMPYEIRINHPSGRIFYFPSKGDDHKDQLSVETLNIHGTLLTDSAIDTLAKNFDTYSLAQKFDALQQVAGLKTGRPENWQNPDLGSTTTKDSYTTHIFRYILKERNFRNKLYYQNHMVWVADVCTDAPIPCYPALRINFRNLDLLIKRMLRYPLPRRIYPSTTDRASEYQWWENRNVALPEYPRGLCHVCEREVWLCENCNRNAKSFCSECMTELIEAQEVRHLSD